MYNGIFESVCGWDHKVIVKFCILNEMDLNRLKSPHRHRKWPVNMGVLVTPTRNATINLCGEIFWD